MAIEIVRLGTPRKDKTKLRLGTVRRPPRGVRKEDYGRLDYYDVWLPLLSPSLGLLRLAQKGIGEEKAWRLFKSKFLAEMKKPEPRQVLNLLAALSRKSDFSLGCYCEKEERCHRSLLRKLLEQLDAEIG
jgi:uncharacterized protein YeaO (DUF488 family)